MVSGWGSMDRDSMCCHLPRALSKPGDLGVFVTVGNDTGVSTCRWYRYSYPANPPPTRSTRAATSHPNRENRRRARGARLVGPPRRLLTGAGPGGPSSPAPSWPTYRWSPEYPRASPPNGAPSPCHGLAVCLGGAGGFPVAAPPGGAGELAKRNPGLRLPPDRPMTPAFPVPATASPGNSGSSEAARGGGGPAAGAATAGMRGVMPSASRRASAKSRQHPYRFSGALASARAST